MQGFIFSLCQVQVLCYTSCFKLFACLTAVTLSVNSFVVFVGKCKKNMTSLKGIWCWYFLSFLRSVWGWGVQSHPARPETQTWHHHEVPTQTQDLAVQANVQRRKSWVSAAPCWLHVRYCRQCWELKYHLHIYIFYSSNVKYSTKQKQLF